MKNNCDNSFRTVYGITDGKNMKTKQELTRKAKTVPAHKGMSEIVERESMCLHTHYQLATELPKHVDNKNE